MLSFFYTFYIAVTLQHTFVFSLATRERPHKFIFLSPSNAFLWSSKSESYFILCVVVIFNGQGLCGLRNKHYFFPLQWWCLITDRFMSLKVRVTWTLFFSKDCQNSAWQAVILDVDYSLFLLCVTSFCLILRNLVKRKRRWRFVSWDLTANEIIPYLHQGKFGKFIDSFLDWSGTLQFSEPSNEQIDWGYCLSWEILVDYLYSLCLWGWWGGKQPRWLCKTFIMNVAVYRIFSTLAYLKVSNLANPFYQKVLTILEKIMNCYCFCSYKELESLLKGYGKVITTRVLRGAYRVSKGVAFAR